LERRSFSGREKEKDPLTTPDRMDPVGVRVGRLFFCRESGKGGKSVKGQKAFAKSPTRAIAPNDTPGMDYPIGESWVEG